MWWDVVIIGQQNLDMSYRDIPATTFSKATKYPQQPSHSHLYRSNVLPRLIRRLIDIFAYGDGIPQLDDLLDGPAF
jgi:hypothetical protein